MSLAACIEGSNQRSRARAGVDTSIIYIKYIIKYFPVYPASCASSCRAPMRGGARGPGRPADPINTSICHISRFGGVRGRSPQSHQDGTGLSRGAPGLTEF